MVSDYYYLLGLRCFILLFTVYLTGNNKYVEDVPRGACHTSGLLSLVKIHRYNKKCPYAKLNRYEDNVAIKMWSSCGSTYCTFLTLCVNRTVQLFLEPIAKALLLFKVLGNLRAVFMRLTKIAKSDYSHRHICLSVRPSACINSAPTERGFHKI